MPRFRANGTLTRDAVADLWKHSLSRIPTIFGQIVYLASLRDSNSGVYKHHGLSAAFGRDESVRALRESHERAFGQWLQMPLAERADDLRAFLETLEDAEDVVAGHWLTSRAAVSQAPSSAKAMEVELFRQDFETLLKIIRNGSAAGQRRPGSSRPR